MTKTTREEDNAHVFFAGIIVTLLFFLIFYFAISDEINSKIETALKDVPHKVCHNETIPTDYVVCYVPNSLQGKGLPESFEYKLIKLDYYTNSTNSIYSSNGSDNLPTNCYINYEIKEVCEII